MYWQDKGKKNTAETVKSAVKRAIELKINNLVVASCSGDTALSILNQTEPELKLNIVCVTHHVGFAGPGIDEMTPEIRQRLHQAGVQVLTTTHLMAGLDRAVRNKFGGVYPSEIMAQTLRMFGQGVKVCIEVAGMALDAGMIPYGEEIISLAGSGEGSDTAIVITPAHSNHFFDTKIKEIICKPREC